MRGHQRGILVSEFVRCDDCDYTWKPRTTTRGQNVAVVRALAHAKHHQHRTVVIRRIEYDHRSKSLAVAPLASDASNDVGGARPLTPIVSPAA